MFAQDAKYQRRTLGLTFVAPCGPGAKKFFKNPLTNSAFYGIIITERKRGNNYERF